jgi:hypothetical protein
MVPQLSGAEALLDGGRQGRSRGRVRSIGLWQVDAAICPPDGTGAVEELALELRGNSIPAQKHGCAQALQNLVFFLSEGNGSRYPFSVESSYRNELPTGSKLQYSEQEAQHRFEPALRW